MNAGQKIGIFVATATADSKPTKHICVVHNRIKWNWKASHDKQDKENIEESNFSKENTLKWEPKTETKLVILELAAAAKQE